MTTHHYSTVPPTERRFVIVNGYHATSSENVESILENGFRLSENAEDWLGDGIYFWQDAPARAWQYAKEKRQQERFNGTPAVVGAQILLPLGATIDLFDAHWIHRLRRKYFQLLSGMLRGGMEIEEYEKTFRQSTDIETPKARRVDRLVINSLVGEIAVREGHPIMAVRASFPEGAPVYPESGFRTKSHVQLAIREPKLIDPEDERGSSVGVWLEPEPLY